MGTCPRTSPGENLHVLPASGGTLTTSTTVSSSCFGTAPQPTPNRPQMVALLPWLETSCVMTGRSHKVVPTPITTQSMHALVAEAPAMVLSNALRCSHTPAVTPYKLEVWWDFLVCTGLIPQYPSLMEGLTHSFHAHMPPLSQTFTLPNHPSISQYREAFDSIVHKEFTQQWYIGPLTVEEIQCIVGHFQSSPISLIPKPGRPGKYHMIQDLLYPWSPSPTSSINMRMLLDDFTASYSIFPIVSLLIALLPPGLQGAVRDVAEAYHTVPVHPSQ